MTIRYDTSQLTEDQYEPGSNGTVLRNLALHRSLVHYDTVVVPWGGMHMPAIESALLERGFVPGDKKQRLLFAFSAIPFAVLWKGGGGASP